jgi:hypothetical protein
MRVFLFTWCGVLSFFGAFSQKEYQSGYVVMTAGDTVRCLIAYKRNDENPSVITVKKSEGDAENQYDVSTITAFSVAGETYERAIVDVDISPYKIDRLDSSPIPTLKRDTVFLLILVRGEKTLAFLKDHDAKRHFFIFDDAYVPLTYKKYVKNTSGKKEVHENSRYIGQLTEYLDQCPTISTRINQLKYNERTLLSLFEEYHECINKPIETQFKRREIDVEAGILAGVSLTSNAFSGLESFAYLTEAEYEKSVNPVLGFYVDFKLLRSSGMRINNDIAYGSYDVKGSSAGVINSTSAYTSDSRFNCHYIKWTPSFQLSLYRQGVIYVSLGGALTANFKSDAEVYITYGGSGGSTTEKEFEPRTLLYGVLGGLGSHLGRFTVEARYEWTTGISDYYKLASHLRHANVVLRYRLGREK